MSVSQPCASEQYKLACRDSAYKMPTATEWFDEIESLRKQLTTAKQLAINTAEGLAEATKKLIAAEARINYLELELTDIAELAHTSSTGPAIEDNYWEIRGLAYGARDFHTDNLQALAEHDKVVRKAALLEAANHFAGWNMGVLQVAVPELRRMAEEIK